MEKIIDRKFRYRNMCIIRDKMLKGETKETILDQEGILSIKSNICVPKVDKLTRLIIDESHSLRYSIILVHP